MSKSRFQFLQYRHEINIMEWKNGAEESGCLERRGMMRSVIAVLTAAVCLFSMAACGRMEPGQAEAVLTENCSGVVTECFQEGTGAERTNRIRIETGTGEPMVFALTDAAQISGAQAAAEGDTVEIEYERHTDSGECVILSLRVTVPAAESVIVAEPPALMVASGGTKTRALLGTYSWMYKKDDGTATGICADSAHPLQSRQSMKALDRSRSDSSVATLQFEVTPDVVSVYCWDASCWGTYNVDGEPVTVEKVAAEFEGETSALNHFIVLRDGEHIYEVVAE